MPDPDTVNTGGGAYVKENIEAETFIGRDLTVTYGYTAEQLDQLLPRLCGLLSNPQAELRADTAQGRLTVTAPHAPYITLSEQAATDLLPVACRQADERAYLTALVVNPRYGRWAHQFVPLAGTLTTHDHPPGWADIPPEFTKLEVMGEGAQRQIRRIPLEDIIQAIESHPALALLGEPGAGKTTTLHRLLFDAARTRLTTGKGYLPILLPLADYRDYPSPYTFLEEKWTQSIGMPEMAQRLRQGELLLLCDALNEMPFRDTRNYRERVGAWRRFTQEWPGNRLIFTCRSRDYSEPLGLPQVEIERLDNGRVQDFLKRYLAAELAGQSWDKLKDSPLLELVRNPYYLNMLAFLLATDGYWPANRAGLFQGYVMTLLGREQQRDHPDWLGEAPLVRALAGLAETMQPLGEGIRLSKKEVLARLPQQVEGSDGVVTTPPASVLRLGLAATLLDVELSTSGEEEVRFFHHQLQEYFAARALLERFRVGEDLSDRWRQLRFTHEMPDPGPLRDDEPLPPPLTTGWEEPTLLVAGLALQPETLVEAVRRTNPVLAARCLVEAGVTRDPAQVAAVQENLLQTMTDRRIHRRARLAVGEALGWLGDPRFELIQVNGQQVLLPPLVTIPAGPFHMGSGRWEVWRLTRRGIQAQDERPRHRVDVPEFAIGKYPVTNAEFACFIAARGYQEECWWPTEQARRWRRNELESGVVDDWMNLWRRLKEDPSQLRQQDWSPQSIADWERFLTWDEEAFRQQVSRTCSDRPRDQPAYWNDERFKNPSQPVVGVTWFEAQAYCRWLDEQWRAVGREGKQSLPDGHTVRLPTEAEWEKAARTPQNGRYPWGNRWNPDCANTSEGHVLHPTPVGIYPRGATAAAVHDLSGNIWEWTLSLYRSYLYVPDEGRNNPEAEGFCVVRGGSWLVNGRFARCTCRYGDPPNYFDSDLGFRVVVSLANSEY